MDPIFNRHNTWKMPFIYIALNKYFNKLAKFNTNFFCNIYLFVILKTYDILFLSTLVHG